jgi:hypothetical protein
MGEAHSSLNYTGRMIVKDLCPAVARGRCWHAFFDIDEAKLLVHALRLCYTKQDCESQPVKELQPFIQ